MSPHLSCAWMAIVSWICGGALRGVNTKSRWVILCLKKLIQLPPCQDWDHWTPSNTMEGEASDADRIACFDRSCTLNDDNNAREKSTDDFSEYITDEFSECNLNCSVECIADNKHACSDIKASTWQHTQLQHHAPCQSERVHSHTSIHTHITPVTYQ